MPYHSLRINICHPARQDPIYNPIGTGSIDFNNPPAQEVLPAAHIFYEDEKLEWGQITNKHAAGFAPLAPSWEGRLQFAGCYDEHWKETRHPLLPRDFDDRFWNAALANMAAEDAAIIENTEVVEE